MQNKYLLFSLGTNEKLSEKVSQILNIQLSPVSLSTFSDGEISLQLQDNCRGKKVFIIQSTSQPDNNFIKLALAVDAARRASAKEITVVVPYFGYARQERKPLPGTPISARVFATFLESLGVDRLITMDLHTSAIEGFFIKTGVDHLLSESIFVEELRKDLQNEIAMGDVVVVAPDTGGANRARAFSVSLLGHSDLAIVSKGRERANVISSMELVGTVAGKVAVLVDDLADTCGTLVKAAKLLKSNGAQKVVAVVTHPVLSKDAKEKVKESEIEYVYVTDTIEHLELPNKFKIISAAKVFADKILEINSD